MLILLPNLLGTEGLDLLPPAVATSVEQLDGLIAESERKGRLFLSHFKTKKPVQEIPIAVLDDGPEFLLEPLTAGETWGVVSDAGLPCLADPGAKLVARARQKGITVRAISGPCSITLALMLAGLPAQRFAFHGYLNRDRVPHIRELERRSGQESATQVIIEAPYRNQHTLKALIETLKPETLLAVAWELTQPDETVICKPAREWKETAEFHKKPAIFLIYSSEKGKNFARKASRSV